MNKDFSKKAVIFDLDGTLLNGNSTDLLVKYFIKKGLIGKREFPKYFKYLFQLKTGILSYSGFAEIVAERWKNYPVEKLERMRMDFYEECLKKRIFIHFADLLKEYKKNGSYLFLISSANFLAAEPVIKPLGFDNICASRFEVDENGLITGKLIKPLCYKSGKVFYFKKLCKEYSLDIRDSVFYTNSINDISLLRIVGKPVAVNPDSQLKKIALNKKWEILNLINK